jgi:hypothetical protein
MPANPSTTEMGRRHVEHVAEVLGIAPSAASGSKWQNPADGRSAHDIPYPIAVECKSTRGKSLTETLDMIAKLREQALGENPVLPLRWYGTDDLSVVLEDWAAVPLDFLGEVLASARAWVTLETSLGNVSRDDVAALILKAGTADTLVSSLADAHESLLRAGERIAAQDLELEALRRGQPTVPQETAHPLPRLPWAVVSLFPEGVRRAGPSLRRAAADAHGRDPIGVAYDYAADGARTSWDVFSVRVERTMGNRPRLLVNDVAMTDCDLYGRNGLLLARVCRDTPSVEVG